MIGEIRGLTKSKADKLFAAGSKFAQEAPLTLHQRIEIHDATLRLKVGNSDLEAFENRHWDHSEAGSLRFGRKPTLRFRLVNCPGKVLRKKPLSIRTNDDKRDYDGSRFGEGVDYSGRCVWLAPGAEEHLPTSHEEAIGKNSKVIPLKGWAWSLTVCAHIAQLDSGRSSVRLQLKPTPCGVPRMYVAELG